MNILVLLGCYFSLCTNVVLILSDLWELMCPYMSCSHYFCGGWDITNNIKPIHEIDPRAVHDLLKDLTHLQINYNNNNK